MGGSLKSYEQVHFKQDTLTIRITDIKLRIQSCVHFISRIHNCYYGIYPHLNNCYIKALHFEEKCAKTRLPTCHNICS